MFNLTLHDHLHLTFNEIIQRHDAHAAKAHSPARWSRWLRGSEALLIGGVAMTAAGAAAFGHGQMLAIVAASLACLALIILLGRFDVRFRCVRARARDVQRASLGPARAISLVALGSA